MSAAACSHLTAPLSQQMADLAFIAERILAFLDFSVK